MPYRDHRDRLHWNQRSRVLCPTCPNLMWPESTRCRDCYLDAVRAPSRPLKAASGNPFGTSRPQPVSHPWRKSLTGMAA